MGWTVSTYAGTKMGGQPSNARTAMFELMRGVNERQGAVNITKTQFYKTDGTLGSDLASSDIAEIEAFPPSQRAFLNLKKIRDAIIAMSNSGKFTTTTGGSTQWTKATLETAIGTDLDADPIRTQEARFWQAMQDALDLLKFGRLAFSGTLSGTSMKREGTGATKGIAWAAAVSDTPTPSSTVNEAYWENFGGLASIYDNVFTVVDLTNYSGTIIGGEYRIQVGNGSDIDIDWTAGDITGSLAQNASGGGSIYNVVHSWTNTYSTGAPLSIPISIDTAVPASNPFITLSSNVFVRIVSPVFYTDLATILTDQA